MNDSRPDPDLAAPTSSRGSCLCGAVGFVAKEDLADAALDAYLTS